MSELTWELLQRLDLEITAALRHLERDCAPFSSEWRECETIADGKRYTGWFRINEEGKQLAAHVCVYDESGMVAKAAGDAFSAGTDNGSES